MNTKLRIGIIGCSTIAKNSTIPAIQKSEKVEVICIGSRFKEKAKEFADRFSCEDYGNYEDVLKNENVDAVYISTPIGNHEEWVLKSANSGKHIICEKSSTFSYNSAKKMIEVCKKNDKRIMEGFMFRFHPSHQKVKEIINNGLIGNVYSFNGRYGFPPMPKTNIRYVKSLGGGILNDAGCYPINASRLLFDSEPKGVQCNLHIDEETEVDVKAAISMKFESDKISHSTVAYDMFYQSIYSLWGSKGFLELSRAYNVPPDMKATLFVKNNDSENKISIEAVDHFQLMIDTFCDEIYKSKSCYYNFEKDLLNQAKVMEACRLSDKEKRYVELEEIQ